MSNMDTEPNSAEMQFWTTGSRIETPQRITGTWRTPATMRLRLQ